MGKKCVRTLRKLSVRLCRACDHADLPSFSFTALYIDAWAPRSPETQAPCVEGRGAGAERPAGAKESDIEERASMMAEVE